MLTFQWKPLSPRFSPDISRILTLRMHERRISQRNTDAANPTPRPRLPPRQVPQPWLGTRYGRRVSLGKADLVWRVGGPLLLPFIHAPSSSLPWCSSRAPALPPIFLNHTAYLGYPMCWHERQAHSRSQCSHVGCVVQLQTYL